MSSSLLSGLFGGGYSCSLPAQAGYYRCGSEEVHSSSGSPSPAATQQLAAVVGTGSSAGVAAGSSATVVGTAGITAGSSSATVGSAPAEYWPRGGGGASDMLACGPGTGSFPSSPSSLGFMTGSFGDAAGDDDLFGFDDP